MAKKLTDLSQLTKAILKESPPPRPVEKPASEPSQSREDADAAVVRINRRANLNDGNEIANKCF